MNYELRIMNYELWITNYELRIMNYELWIMNYELRIMNYELRIMNYKLCPNPTSSTTRIKTFHAIEITLILAPVRVPRPAQQGLRQPKNSPTSIVPGLSEYHVQHNKD